MKKNIITVVYAIQEISKGSMEKILKTTIHSISVIIIFVHLIINLSLSVPSFIHVAYKNTVQKSLCP